jgi:hypothetical protein
MENISTFGIYNWIILLGFVYFIAFTATNKRYLQVFPSVSFLSFYTLSFLYLIYKKLHYKLVSVEDLDRNVYLLLICVLFSFLTKFLKAILYKSSHHKSTTSNKIVENTKLPQQQIQTQDFIEKNINSVSFSIQEKISQVNIVNVKIKEQHLTENESKKVEPIDCDINIPKTDTGAVVEFDAIKAQTKEALNIHFIERNIKNKFQTQNTEIVSTESAKKPAPLVNTNEEQNLVAKGDLIKHLEEHFVKKEFFEDQLLLVNKRIDLSVEDSQSFIDKVTYFIKIINSELKKR